MHPGQFEDILGLINTDHSLYFPVNQYKYGTFTAPPVNQYGSFTPLPTYQSFQYRPSTWPLTSPGQAGSQAESPSNSSKQTAPWTQPNPPKKRDRALCGIPEPLGPSDGESDWGYVGPWGLGERHLWSERAMQPRAWAGQGGGAIDQCHYQKMQLWG